MIQYRTVVKGLGALVGAIGLAASPFSVSAEGLYIGAGLGQSKVDAVECSPEIRVSFSDVACSADETDTAFKIFGGYEFASQSGSPFFGAIEIGYVDFGEVSISGVDSFYGVSRMSWDSSGFNLAAIGALQANDWLSVMGKVGLLRWDWDVDFRNEDEIIEDFSDSDSGTDIMFGIGANFSLTEQARVRVEWERFEIGDEDVDLMSASFTYRF